VFVALTYHHPHPDHVDDLMGHMERVVELVRERAEGLHEFSCWREAGGTRLLGLSRWESRASFEAAVPLITSRREHRRPEWSTADDETFVLEDDG
jgi:heme-degrading monooxygenase HmoA